MHQNGYYHFFLLHSTLLMDISFMDIEADTMYGKTIALDQVYGKGQVVGRSFLLVVVMIIKSPLIHE